MYGRFPLQGVRGVGSEISLVWSENVGLRLTEFEIGELKGLCHDCAHV